MGFVSRDHGDGTVDVTLTHPGGGTFVGVVAEGADVGTLVSYNSQGELAPVMGGKTPVEETIKAIQEGAISMIDIDHPRWTARIPHIEFPGLRRWLNRPLRWEWLRHLEACVLVLLRAKKVSQDPGDE